MTGAFVEVVVVVFVVAAAVVVVAVVVAAVDFVKFVEEIAAVFDIVAGSCERFEEYLVV